MTDSLSITENRAIPIHPEPIAKSGEAPPPSPYEEVTQQRNRFQETKDALVKQLQTITQRFPWIGRPAEAAIAVAEVDFEQATQEFAGEAQAASEAPDALGRYLQHYGLDHEVQIQSLLAEAPEVTVKLIADGVAPDLAGQILRFEQQRPQYEQYSFTTHAQRLEHYQKMLGIAQEKGVGVGFQLRSKEENNALGIGVVSHSPSGKGGEGEAGETFTSWTQNRIAGLYGDVVWVGQHDVLLHKPELGYKARDAEINVYSDTGRIIDGIKKLDKYGDQDDPNAQAIKQGVVQLYNSLKNGEQGEPAEQLVTSVEDIATVRAGLQQLLETTPITGVDLFNPYAVCLVPQEYVTQMEEAIAASTLTTDEKAFLQSQIIPYKGYATDALTELINDKDGYIEGVAQRQHLQGHIVGSEDVRQALDLHEALARTALVKDNDNFYSLSDTPAMESSSDPFTTEIAIALRDRLGQTDAWQFLNELPREADGILYPILRQAMRTAVAADTEPSRNITSRSEHDHIQAFLQDLGHDLGKPWHELAIERQEYINNLLNLKDIASDQSAINHWKKKVFPFRP